MTSMRHNLRPLTANILTLAFILPLCCISCQAENVSTSAPAALPSTLIGTWQVIEVHIDTGASWRRYYHQNDPRLTGRLFTVARQQLTTTALGEAPCVNPMVVIRRTTAAELIKNSMAGRHTVPETPTPKDYELPLANNASVDMLSVSCKETGLFGGSLGHEIGGAWIVILSEDQLAIRWYDETILLLRRLPDNAKPVASFNCNNATTVVEKTLCGSVALAALDQSLAQTYTFAVKVFKEAENPKALAQLKVTQKQWLTQRNACGTDVSCLEKSMKDRMYKIEAASDLRGQ